MTFDEVISKWNPKHRSAVNDILICLKNSDGKNVTIPKNRFRNMVTTQIMTDLGFSLSNVGRVNGKKAFYTYKKLT